MFSIRPPLCTRLRQGFSGFRRGFDRRHGCQAYVATLRRRVLAGPPKPWRRRKLLRRSRLKPWGSTTSRSHDQDPYSELLKKSIGRRSRPLLDWIDGFKVCGRAGLARRDWPESGRRPGNAVSLMVSQRLTKIVVTCAVPCCELALTMRLIE